MNNGVSRVLVLGGFGFIGSHLCRGLLSSGYQVRALGRKNSKRVLLNDILDDIEIFEGDIGSADEMLHAMRDIDIVVHAVHTTVPQSSMRNPAYDICSNVALPITWISCLNETSVKKIIYISSGGTVYGIPQLDMISEDHPTNPICSYGVTKLMNEKYLSMYAGFFGIKCIIVRPSNIYGFGQRLDKEQGVIGTLLNRALLQKTLEIWGDGSSLRDYLYIDDAISGLLKLLQCNDVEGVFNMSSGVGHSVLEIVSLLQSYLGQELDIKHVPWHKHDTPVNILNSSKLMDTVDWLPKISLYSGIGLLVEALTA